MIAFLRRIPISNPSPPPFRRLSSSPPPPLVAVFWDLHNKPPNTIPPYDAAVRLNLAASSLGRLRFTVAYATHHASRHLPAPPPSVPYLCRVCGRNFYNHSKLITHFRHLHDREQAKRQRRIETARGARHVRLAASLSMKMEKYKRAAQDLLAPRAGYGLADELRRAGVIVRTVDDRPETADMALRQHMVDTMDKGKIGCLVLVSDDAGFAGVLREARMRRLRTVVVGDEGDGALKRCADAGFSWQEVVSGKARKEAASAVGKWKDRDLMKRLEWTHKPESSVVEFDGFEGGNSSDNDGGGTDGLVGKTGAGPWWKLNSEADETSDESDEVSDGDINC